ncbi:MAG: glycosyltransferase [Prevotellaceae bacterium]|jgi:rhamnosyltransferase|nr:glycosyltransferase [Prevotellaceae bacterium]
MNKLITKDNLCAVVVWYNPTEDMAQNICHYAGKVSHVFVIDNSDADHQSLLHRLQLSNTHYHSMAQNKGIAAALNTGFALAKSYNAEWMLTMDQDSIFEGDSFEHYVNEINLYEKPQQVGIFSVKHAFGVPETHVDTAQYVEKKWVMCSGNIMLYSAYEQAGDFREDFFNDWVDYEFCVRIKEADYTIVECSGTSLTHFMGTRLMTTRFLGTKKYVTDYPVWRRYYLARNMYLTSKLHRELKYSLRWRLIQEFKVVLLYDHSAKKWQKFKAMWRAVCESGKPVDANYIIKKYGLMDKNDDKNSHILFNGQK